MKKSNLLVIWAIAFILPLSTFGQDTTQFTVAKGVPIYKDSSDMFSRVWLPKAIKVYIVNYTNQNRYYPIQYDNTIYYITNSYLKGGLPTAAKSATGDIISYYVKLYGTPSDVSEYSSGDYKSKTYVWHCAAGKYRSLDFVYKGGKWVKDSEYTSDCIR